MTEPTIVQAVAPRASDSVKTAPEQVDADGLGQRDEPLVELDTLIEDVSIDGMCGVY